MQLNKLKDDLPKKIFSCFFRGEGVRIKIGKVKAFQKSTQILFLVAEGFDESDFLSCLIKMRKEGFNVSLVGLIPGNVTGLHGLTVCPDIHIDLLPTGLALRLIVIPGNYASLRKLWIDPRVYSLFDHLQFLHGVLAILSTSRSIFEEGRAPEFIKNNRTVIQLNQQVDSFTKKLIQLIK